MHTGIRRKRSLIAKAGLRTAIKEKLKNYIESVSHVSQRSHIPECQYLATTASTPLRNGLIFKLHTKRNTGRDKSVRMSLVTAGTVHCVRENPESSIWVLFEAVHVSCEAIITL